MKRTFNLLTAIAALLALQTGCTVMVGGRGYHVDRGDLVSNDRTIRYVGWCDSHPRSADCVQWSASNGVVASVLPAESRIDSQVD
jgi:hypothetical protein